MVYFHCECKWPSDQYMEDRLQEKQQNQATRGRREMIVGWICRTPGILLRDDESDWAEVCAFEYTDNEVIFWDVKVTDSQQSMKGNIPILNWDLVLDLMLKRMTSTAMK